ncbi:hypothetical protein A2960_01630 [Candidatus Gottesmanbacteria bacterium RIFCSPLOWO2_01_FULL_39_12b]|uniref:UPF0102 protein A2960_01630 n=1 Tax=Candidatus Gottesmanbacteria bacterium RIFCSPLOWO2_01_FULL_39_12b TaxID=1798388 RepID=A0A1F6AQ78_9BACT|nr:MAG: hypothetical protein A2960_01630 [Candidatus Gottesmanbacteria bacterium RIFCSPLOWO2_01_FULL_39_12b]
MQVKNKITLGKQGEEIAAKYLKQQGYQIIERNFQRRYKEIDIVALDKNTLVFVEVKTRQGDKFGTPSEAITSFKLRNLVQSAQYYKFIHPNLPDSMRIDFVGISIGEDFKLKEINLIKNITS